jgi:hypothetical protein
MNTAESPTDQEMLNWKHSEGTQRFVASLHASIDDIKDAWATGGYRSADHTKEMRLNSAAQGKAEALQEVIQWIADIKLPEKEQDNESGGE